MKYFIFLIISVWFVVGCEDLLEMEPKNSLTYGNSMTEKELEASAAEINLLIKSIQIMCGLR